MLDRLPFELLELVFEKLLLEDVAGPTKARRGARPGSLRHLPLCQALRQSVFHEQTVCGPDLLPNWIDFSGDSSSYGAGEAIVKRHIDTARSAAQIAPILSEMSNATLWTDEAGIEALRLDSLVGVTPTEMLGIRYSRVQLLRTNLQLLWCSLVSREWHRRFKPHLLRFVISLLPDERASDVAGSPALRGAPALDRFSTKSTISFALALGRVLPSDHRTDNGPERFQTFAIDLLRHNDAREKLVATPSVVAYAADGTARVEAPCLPSLSDMRSANLNGLPADDVQHVLLRTTRIDDDGSVKTTFSSRREDSFHDLGRTQVYCANCRFRQLCFGALVAIPRYLPAVVIRPPKTTSRALAKACGVPLAPLRLKVVLEFATSGARVVVYSSQFYLTTRSLLPEEVATAAELRKEKRKRA